MFLTCRIHAGNVCGVSLWTEVPVFVLHRESMCGLTGKILAKNTEVPT